MPLAGQVHPCWKCARRLPVDNVIGSVVVICPKCKEANHVRVAAPVIARDRC